MSLFFVYLFLCHDHTHMASLEIDLSLIFDLGWTLTLTILTLIVWLERDKSDFFEVLLQKIRIRRGLHHVNRMIARMQLLDYNLKHKKIIKNLKKKFTWFGKNLNFLLPSYWSNDSILPARPGSCASQRQCVVPETTNRSMWNVIISFTINFTLIFRFQLSS